MSYYSEKWKSKRQSLLSEKEERKYKLVVVPRGSSLEAELFDDPLRQKAREKRESSWDSSEIEDEADEQDYKVLSDGYRFERGFASPSAYKKARSLFEYTIYSNCYDDNEIKAMVNRAINKAVFGTHDYRKYFHLSEYDSLTELPPEYLFRLTKLLTEFSDFTAEENAESIDVNFVSVGGILKVMKKMGLFPEADVIIWTKVAGVSYEGRQEFLKKCQPGDKLELIRNRNNEYDKNAIAVFHEDNQLGFLCTELAEKLAPLFDNGREFSCEVLALIGEEEKSGLRISIKQEGGRDDIPAGLYDINAGGEFIRDIIKKRY